MSTMDCALKHSSVKEIHAMPSKFMRVLRLPFCFNVCIITSSFTALCHQLSPPTMPKLQEILSAVLNKGRR